MKKPTAIVSGAAALTAAAALAIAGASLASADSSSTATAGSGYTAQGAPGYSQGRQAQTGNMSDQTKSQRSDETLLTGDTLTKVTAAAKAKEPTATVLRAETDADGHGKYEVHMTAADGSRLTVYVDDSFAVTSVETGQSGPRGQRGQNGPQGQSGEAPSGQATQVPSGEATT